MYSCLLTTGHVVDIPTTCSAVRSIHKFQPIPSPSKDICCLVFIFFSLRNCINCTDILSNAFECLLHSLPPLNTGANFDIISFEDVQIGFWLVRNSHDQPPESIGIHIANFPQSCPCPSPGATCALVPSPLVHRSLRLSFPRLANVLPFRLFRLFNSTKCYHSCTSPQGHSCSTWSYQAR